MKIFSRKQKPLHEIILQSDNMEEALMKLVRSNSYVPTKQDMEVKKRLLIASMVYGLLPCMLSAS